MKNIKIAISGIALALSAGSACAQAYLGGSIGWAKHDQNKANWTNATTSTTYDNDDTGFKIFGGWQINQSFAIEAQYVDLGNYAARLTSVAPADSGNVTVDVKSFGLYAVGSLPLTQSWALTGKLGLSHNRSSMRFSSGGAAFGATDSGSHSRTSAGFGIGASYAFNRNVSLRVEWESLGKAGDNNGNFTIRGKTSNSDPSMLSAGVKYQF